MHLVPLLALFVSPRRCVEFETRLVCRTKCTEFGGPARGITEEEKYRYRTRDENKRAASRSDVPHEKKGCPPTLRHVLFTSAISWSRPRNENTKKRLRNHTAISIRAICINYAPLARPFGSSSWIKIARTRRDDVVVTPKFDGPARNNIIQSPNVYLLLDINSKSRERYDPRFFNDFIFLRLL